MARSLFTLPAHGARTTPHPATRRSPGRAIRETLTVAGITLALTLAFLEIGLRVFAPQYSPEMRYAVLAGLFTGDPATGYRNAPGAHIRHHTGEIDVTYDINRQGLREAHEIGPPAPGTARVLVLGDSFTFGAGVPSEQTYAHLLAGSRAADGSVVEGINAGVDGYGTDNEETWLATYGWSLQPRMVLLGFFAGNDARDNFLGIHKTLVNAQGELVESESIRRQFPGTAGQQTPTGPLGSAKQWLAEHSDAFVFLRGLAHALAAPLVPSPPQVVQPGPFDTAPVYYRSEPADVAKGWDRTFTLLDGLREAAAAHGVPLVVVVIPAREQVDDRDWQQMQVHFGLSSSALERDHPQRRLAAWSAHSGTPLIDLLPGFRDAPAGQALYFGYDIHWTPAGHQLAARLIRDGLVRLGLWR